MNRPLNSTVFRPWAARVTLFAAAPASNIERARWSLTQPDQ
jgi:hypothetical protein